MEENNPIKAIVFDVGGVYMAGNFEDFLQRCYDYLPINKIYIKDGNVAFYRDFNLGLISADECFEKVFKMSLTPEQLKVVKGYWKTTWRPRKEMLELLPKLQKNYRLAVLSNSDALNSANFFKLGWYKYFDPLVLSHEERILKPDKRIYEILLGRIGLKPFQCIYVDDQLKALQPAIDMGFKTILFRDMSQMESELKSFGIKGF